MNPLHLVLAPVRLTLRALDDLHLLAAEVERGLDGRMTLVERLDEVEGRVAALTVAAQQLTEVARDIRDGGTNLRDVTVDLTGVARDIRDGGQDLTETTKDLDAHVSTMRGELRETEASLDEVQDSMETIAETVEPLQGAAERVGRLTQRLGRR